jgi:hypothetical protein
MTQCPANNAELHQASTLSSASIEKLDVIFSHNRNQLPLLTPNRPLQFQPLPHKNLSGPLGNCR